MLKLLDRLWDCAFPDTRSEREKEEEQQFIRAVNQLKTLRVTPSGSMSIVAGTVFLFWTQRFVVVLPLLKSSPARMLLSGRNCSAWIWLAWGFRTNNCMDVF